ncbi:MULTISPECIES: SRPBCC family protein [Acinetobacter]|uniref:SRPBCC family protein n=1 Tax=Acinetobacter TaxID=469 RepID=UPI0014476776|nr:MULTISPECIES: SRPBCC family protein [Acinetobacter]MBF4520905.1 SRPBCC family protein [Acinetobacter towneri]MCD0187923.1 SRPBCC family protein [Acinetobacter sp. PW68]MDM1486112.1 SRPBCC family protein [Acinetobacter towneri]
MNAIQIKKEFNAPVSQVFELLSKHATYNIAFAPMQVVRVKDSADPERPDGVGSVRRMGIGPIKPLQEQITLLEPNQRIEYKIIKNPLIKHHLGVIEFQDMADNKTLVTYSIELQTRVPFVSKAILAQLKTAIKIGLSKLAKSL